MLKNIIFTFLILPVTLASASALANMNLGLSYGTFKKDGDASMGQLDLRMGYEFASHVYVGAFYALASNKFIDHTNDYNLGASVGYEWKGLYGLASYVFTGEQDLASGGVKFSKARGLQMAIGYRMLVGEDVYLGPEITWRSLKYGDKETQGIPADADRSDEQIYPAVTLLFKF